MLRDWHEKFKCIFSCPVEKHEINQLEVHALYMACKLTLEKEWLRVMGIEIESDSKNVVKWCHDPEGCPWQLSFKMNFISNMQHMW